MPAVNAEIFVEEMFQVFDKDCNGSLDFHVNMSKYFMSTSNMLQQEFLKLTEFAEKGSIKDKLVWSFKVYDKDKSGNILYRMQDVLKFSTKWKHFYGTP